MKTFILSTLLALSTFAMANSATYYRVWQGFKKPALSDEAFIAELQQFMEDTVTIYQNRALNNYLVGIPPKDKPAYVPNEFALVALHSEAIYQQIRATPQGQHYSVPFHKFFQENVEKLENNHAYDMFGTEIDWAQGLNAFYLGVRKQGVENFLDKLKAHITLSKTTLSRLGMKGYIVIANENYEAAFINWESREHMLRAFASEAGQRVLQSGAEFLERLQYQAAVPFERTDVDFNSYFQAI